MHVPFQSAPRRTPESYDSCLQQLEKRPSLDNVKGVVGKCPLNDFKSFHCIDSCPPCIAHDLFEGVIAYDLALAVNYFVGNTSITVKYINRKIRSLKMKGSDQGDKPALVKANMKKLRGNAVQNWNFSRFLPLILGKKVPKGDPVWRMVLKLIDVTRTLTSPAIANTSLPVLKEDIHTYLKMRIVCFPKAPLRPKHHFLEHYAELIKWFGCLMRVATLGCESKHRFFKNAASAKKNFKNITQTLAEEHQLADSAQSIEHLITSFPIFENSSPFHSVNLCNSLQKHLLSFFGLDYLKASAVSEKVRFRGTWYSKGETVVTSWSSKSRAELCLIELIVVNGRSCFISGQCCKAELNSDLQIYVVEKLLKYNVSNIERLPDYVSYPVYPYEYQEVVLLKHTAVPQKLTILILVMSSTDNDSEAVDDVAVVGGLNEVVKLLKPYLNQKNQVPDLTKTLKELGVSNMSHLDLLKEKDLAAYISVISFRQFEKDRQERKEQNDKTVTNDVSVSGYNFKIENIVHPLLWDKLKSDDDILLPTERSSLIDCVGAIIKNNNEVIRAKDVLQKATSIVRAYPTSLGCLMRDEEDVHDAGAVLSNSILHHIRYLQLLERNKKRKILGTVDNGGQKRKKTDNFSKAQNFGLDPERDLPSELPAGETKQTQEEKRAVLVEMSSKGKADVPVILKNMNETYVSLRIDVGKKMRIEPFLARWPFIGIYPVLESHYEALMNANVNDLLSNLTNKYERLEKFFEAECHLRKKGKTAVSTKLREQLKTYRNLGTNVTNGHRFILMIKCAMILMKVEDCALFQQFEEETSFDEVQSCDQFPGDGRPMVAVLGSNPYSQDAKAYVVIENRCINDSTISVFKATIMAFMSYFVFKIAYPRKAAPILYFLQSKVFKMKGAGTKTRREKKDGKYMSAPPTKPDAYLSFMRLYKEYCVLWNAEDE